MNTSENKVTPGSKKPFVHEIPGLMTKKELELVASLEQELKRFDGLVSSLLVPHAAQRRNESVERFVAEPSEENFAALKAASIEEALLEKVLGSMLRQVVEGCRATFIGSAIPQLVPILDRGLERARVAYCAIAEEENERHMKYVGTPSRQSPIVAAASAPMEEIRRIKNAMIDNSRLSEAIDFLRAHPTAE